MLILHMYMAHEDAVLNFRKEQWFESVACHIIPCTDILVLRVRHICVYVSNPRFVSIDVHGNVASTAIAATTKISISAAADAAIYY